MANESIPALQVPNPPASPETQAYYFIYGEWTKVVEAKAIVAPGQQPSQPQVYKYGFNEAISMHPAIYTILVQEQRPGYTVKAWSGISKELFEWWCEVQKRKNAILDLLDKQNGG